MRQIGLLNLKYLEKMFLEGSSFASKALLYSQDPGSEVKEVNIL